MCLIKPTHTNIYFMYRKYFAGHDSLNHIEYGKNISISSKLN